MSYTSFDPNASTSGRKNEEKYREWELQPQNEYRFELAPSTSIGIKVRSCCGPWHAPGIHFTDESTRISSWTDMLNVLESNSPPGYRTCSGESVKLSSTPTVDVRWR